MADARAEYNELERRIDEEIRHQSRQRSLWVITGIVLIVLLLAYFIFMSGQVAKAAEPAGIADIAGSKIREQLPKMRQDLSQTIRAEAPVLTDELIDRLINDTIPQGRVRLEEAALQHAEAAITEAERMLIMELENHLAQNEEEIRLVAQQLPMPEGKEELEERIYEGLKVILEDPHMKQGLQQGHETLSYAAAVLEYLANPENELTPQEDTTRELIAILIEVGNRSEMEPSTKSPTEKIGMKKLGPSPTAGE